MWTRREERAPMSAKRSLRKLPLRLGTSARPPEDSGTRALWLQVTAGPWETGRELGQPKCLHQGHLQKDRHISQETPPRRGSQAQMARTRCGAESRQVRDQLAAACLAVGWQDPGQLQPCFDDSRGSDPVPRVRGLGKPPCPPAHTHTCSSQDAGLFQQRARGSVRLGQKHTWSHSQLCTALGSTASGKVPRGLRAGWQHGAREGQQSTQQVASRWSVQTTGRAQATSIQKKLIPKGRLPLAQTVDKD